MYLGAVTRYRVRLDVGGEELIVLQQNLHQSSMQALEVQGTAVRLAWSPENNRFLHDEGPWGSTRKEGEEHEEAMGGPRRGGRHGADRGGVRRRNEPAGAAAGEAEVAARAARSRRPRT